MPISNDELVDGIMETLRERGLNAEDEELKGNVFWENTDGTTRVVIWNDAALQGPMPDEATLAQKAAVCAARRQNAQTEEVRLAQVVESARSAIEGMPGWASWTMAEVDAWIDANLVTELATQPKTLQAIRAMAKMLIAMRNKLWADMEDGA